MSLLSRLVLRTLPWFGALLLGGCGSHDGAPAPAGATDATATARELVQDVRRNDLAAFWKSGLSPADYAAVERTWLQRRQPPLTDAQRRDFQRMVRQLTAPDAEATLAAAWQPTLLRLDRQYSDQLPVLIAIGGGMVRRTATTTFALDATQSRELEPLLAPWVAWAQQAPWLDLARSRQAAAICVDTARSLHLTTAEQVRTLDFATAMGRASRLLAGTKQVLALYGLSLDQVLESTRISLASRQGDTAWVRIDYRLQGQPRQAILKMRQLDGRWYPVVLPQLARALVPPDWRGWDTGQSPLPDLAGTTGDTGAVPVQ